MNAVSLHLSALVSHLIREFEAADCEVVRQGPELRVMFPDFDRILKLPQTFPARIFQDLVLVRVNETGELGWELVYWTLPQSVMHASVTLLFVFGYLSSPADPSLLAMVIGAVVGNLLLMLPALWVALRTEHILRRVRRIQS